MANKEKDLPLAKVGETVALGLTSGDVLTGTYAGQTSQNVSMNVRGLKIKIPISEIVGVRHRVVESSHLAD